MRYSVRLSYDGAPFCGWQIQPGAATVQECLETALSTLLRARISVTGAGRTDSNVNAINYLAHFDAADDPLIGASAFCCKLNAILPPQIVVHEVRPERADFHARFDAKVREYRYFLHRHKDPFAAAHSYFFDYPALNVEAMNEAAAKLLGTHDFACFQKAGTDTKTSVCTVTEAVWRAYSPDHVRLLGYTPLDGRGDGAAGGASETASGHETERGPSEATSGHETECDETEAASGHGTADGLNSAPYLVFTIRADRFLRNMVRAVVGTLLDIGRGRHGIGWMDEVLGSHSRSAAGESVPGHALFLDSVEY